MKTKNIFLTVALALCTTFAFAQIATSSHDFSAWAKNGGNEASLCDSCHTPHQSVAIAGAPLWNHDLSTVTTYTNYPSGVGTTMDAIPGNPSGTSLLCLSCHDGTTALDSYGGATGTQYIAAGAKVGDAAVAGTTNNLSSEHPISFTYASAVATDLGLNTEASVVAAGLLNATGDTVECSSCHDVHDQGLGTYALLKVDNASSALCTTCHKK